MHHFLALWYFLAYALRVSSKGNALSGRAGTYNNPVRQGRGADPWVLRYNDSYYMTLSIGQPYVTVTKSNNLASWAPNGTVVYTPGGDWAEVWAPELHYIQGSFYIYVAMDRGNNAQHRMYVLKGTNDTDPTAPFQLVGQVTSPDNNWAIDGTIFKYTDGQLYFIWSGWTNSSTPLEQNLYIARMSSPTTISSERVLLHEPTLAWQRSNGQGVNEGPEVLVHNGRTFLTYSAAGSWGADYCLGLMGIDNGADPLLRANWWVKDDGPVFQKSNAAFSTGHASFTTDRAGVPYIVYHATATADGGWAGRTVRAQTFGWNQDGTPAFPVPVGFNQSLAFPA